MCLLRWLYFMLWFCVCVFMCICLCLCLCVAMHECQCAVMWRAGGYFSRLRQAYLYGESVNFLVVCVCVCVCVCVADFVPLLLRIERLSPLCRSRISVIHSAPSLSLSFSLSLSLSFFLSFYLSFYLSLSLPFSHLSCTTLNSRLFYDYFFPISERLVDFPPNVSF